MQEIKVKNAKRKEKSLRPNRKKQSAL